MLTSSEGIILHQVRYGENSVILTIFTRNFGRQSFIINAARGKKSRNKAGVLQPLFLVELVAYQKQTRDVQRLKEIKIEPAYQSIPFDVIKSAQAIFIAEVLYKTLIGQESSPETYDFIRNALLYFDLMEESPANFHLYFLFSFTSYLGLFPDTRQTAFEGWFDLKKGAIVPFEPSHPFFARKDATPYIRELSKLKIQDLATLKIPGIMRDYLLDKIIEYYRHHMPNLGEIKSLKILKEVFDD